MTPSRLAIFIPLFLLLVTPAAQAKDNADTLCRQKAETTLRQAYREAKATQSWYGKQSLDFRHRLTEEVAKRLLPVFDGIRAGLSSQDRKTLYFLGFYRPSNPTATGTQEDYLKKNPEAQQTVDKIQALWGQADLISCREGFTPERGPATKTGIFEIHAKSRCIRLKNKKLESVKPEITRTIRLLQSDLQAGTRLSICENVRILDENDAEYCNTQNLIATPQENGQTGYAISSESFINGVNLWITEAEYLEQNIPLLCGKKG